MEMKCPCCGSKKLQQYNAMTIIDGDYCVHSYACANCGYVLFFANDFNKLKADYDKTQENNKKKDAIAKEISVLDKAIKDCNMMIEKNKVEIGVLKQKSDDDNITVREQKELLKMAEMKNDDISALMDKIAQLSQLIQEKQREYNAVGCNPFSGII